MRTRTFACLIVLMILLLSTCSDQETAQNLENKDSVDSTLSTVVSDSLVIEMAGVDSLSVFDILMANHEIDYFSTAAGVFVKEIDSIEGGAKLFWVYSVNDTMAVVAADKYITKGGDRVKWHFRRIEM